MIPLSTLLLTLVLPVSQPIQEISAYSGTWQSAITYYTTNYSKASVEHDLVMNDCWRSREYYACHQIVNGESAALIVYTYDTKKKQFVSHVIPAGGGRDSSGALQIVGNVWTYPWSAAESGKTVRYRIMNTFVNADTIRFREEASSSNGGWITLAVGTEHRLSAH